MKKYLAGPMPQSVSWQWPIDLTQYNRDPHLSKLEESALARWQTWFAIGVPRRKWPKDIYGQLTRLTTPIFDSLEVTQADRKYLSSTLNPILQEMAARQTAYWAWTEDDWLAIWQKHFKQDAGKKGGWRQHFIGVMYFIGGVNKLYHIGEFHQYPFALKVFGADALAAAIEPVSQMLLGWGYGDYRVGDAIRRAICEALLINRSPFLANISPELLEELRENRTNIPASDYVAISRALVALGLHEKTIEPTRKYTVNTQSLEGIPPEWASWCQRWLETSTIQTRDSYYTMLLRIGRWLVEAHPGVVSPEQWTRELASEFVAVVCRMKAGDWSHESNKCKGPHQVGKDCRARTKNTVLVIVRTFFLDCQAWGWLPYRFDPTRYLSTPSSIISQIEANPRVIADDIWAKLLWAGLNLRSEDLPPSGVQYQNPQSGYLFYPLELVQALVMVWLFAGLRSDEIYRLRVGCIRWRQDEESGQRAQGSQSQTCLLDVPIHKTGTAFTKPVDRIVGEAIVAWERVRPSQPKQVDAKTAELVDYLFSMRGRRVGKNYLNEGIIPLLCRKAGVPESDARGAITSHRARSTIATQLYNAKEPMSLFELKEWLGHRDLSSTQQYAKISATRTTQAYMKAGYFERNRHTIEVLIDQDAIRSGAVLAGEPWKYYDLGHGYCTYDFFDQCPHRMACARCSFYRPKDSVLAQLLESKTNLERMLQEIPLTDPEREAIDGDLKALEALCAKIVDIPTPSGATPRQLQPGGKVILPVLAHQKRSD